MILDAAVEGLVNFRDAKLLDGRWWRRLNVITKGLSRKKNYLEDQAKFSFLLAQVANSGLTEESFKNAQTGASDTYHDIVGRIKPWLGRNFLHRKKKEITRYRQMYIDRFGVDPTDPAFKAWEAQEMIRLQQKYEAEQEKIRERDPIKKIQRRQEEAAARRAERVHRRKKGR